MSMEITLPKKDLLELLDVTRVLPNTLALPILEGVLIEIKGNTLTATCTDLEKTYVRSLTVEGNGENEGKVVLPAKQLYELVLKLPDGEIKLVKNKENGVTISYGKNKAVLAGYEHDQFPELPKDSPDIQFKIKIEKLKDAIRTVLPAVLTKGSQPVFTGALLEISDKAFRMVGTDTHKIIITQADGIKIENKREYSGDIIVPKEALRSILTIKTDEEDEEVQITIGKNATLAAKGIKYISRLIEAKFPPYRQIIPSDSDIILSAAVNVGEVVAALQRAKLIAESMQKLPTVRLSFKENQVKITSESEQGRLQEEIEAEIQGKEIDEIYFNVNYLIDNLKTIKTEKAIVKIKDLKSPVIIKPTEGTTLTMILPAVKSAEAAA